MLKKAMVVLGLLGAGVLMGAPPNLDIYWIDAEGGASTLIVGPSGQSLLVDTANRRDDDRDAKRIFATAQKAGLKKIDMLITTHYHGDHLGAAEALSKLIPIDMWIDHGDSAEADRPRAAEVYKNYVALTTGKRKIVKAGDKIPLQGTDITVVAAAGKVIPQPINGGGPNAALCASKFDKETDVDPENNYSVGFLLTFGKFKFLDLGDLPWNYELPLVCPTNLVGQVDVYQTTHHGLDRSGAPQVVWAIQPRVAVMNNGPTKGGPPGTFETLRKSPGLADIWQGHLAVRTPKETNAPEDMIANLGPTDGCEGHLLKLSAAPDGSYTMTNLRNGFSKSYKAK